MLLNLYDLSEINFVSRYSKKVICTSIRNVCDFPSQRMPESWHDFP